MALNISMAKNCFDFGFFIRTTTLLLNIFLMSLDSVNKTSGKSVIPLSIKK